MNQVAGGWLFRQAFEFFLCVMREWIGVEKLLHMLRGVD